MDLRLRQLVLVARDKAETVSRLDAVLDLRPVHGSGDLSPYELPEKGPMSEEGRKVLNTLGVENLLFAVGADILEVMFPTRPDSATAGFMDRRGGDTGYMVILQTDDVDRYKALAEKEGVRISHVGRVPNYYDIHLHPRDCGGALLSFATHLPRNEIDGPWYPGGNWQDRPASEAVRGFAAAEMRSSDPQTLAARWGRLLDKPVSRAGAAWVIGVDDAHLRFVPCAPGEKDGFSGIDMRVRSRARVEQGARALGIAINDNALTLCGMTVRLVD